MYITTKELADKNNLIPDRVATVCGKKQIAIFDSLERPLKGFLRLSKKPNTDTYIVATRSMGVYIGNNVSAVSIRITAKVPKWTSFCRLCGYKI